MREVLARDRDPLGGRVERAGVGVDLGAIQVWADLEPDAVHARVSVERAVEVDPAGPVPLGRHLEEDELLEGDPRGGELWEEPAEPGPAGPDDVIGLEGGPPAAGRRGLRTGAIRREADPLAVGPRLADHDPRARLAGPPYQRPHPVGRPQHARLRLMQHEGQVVHGHAREEAGAPPLAASPPPETPSPGR